MWCLAQRILDPLFGLATILPSIAVAVRRLHDLDRGGWWLLLLFVPVAIAVFRRPNQSDDDRVYIPLLGANVLIISFCTKGTEGLNRFGPDPLAATVS